MPVFLKEGAILPQIADEFRKLGDALYNYPAGDGSPRSAASATSILASLKKINATIAAGARAKHLGPAGFAALGREFSKIGTTLSALGAPAKSTARKTAKRTGTRTARKTVTKRKRAR